MEQREPGSSAPGAGEAAELPHRVARVTSYTAAVYGSILVTALVSTLDEEHATASAMAVAVLSTMVVFWIAHVWSDLVGERVETGAAFSPRRAAVLARRQWPMIEAAAAPVAALVLAWTGVWSLATGVWVALVASVLQLGAWGLVVAVRSSSTWPVAIASGLVNLTLGLAIVVLKTLVH